MEEKKQKRSKYNVSSNKDKRTFDGIVFDSELEMKFYRDWLIPKVQHNLIEKYELQKKYELQPSFEYQGVKYKAINYVADFYIVFKNGKEMAIDTKGMPDSTAKLKKKLMHYKYPDLDYKWVKYVKKFGGWITVEEYDKKKKEEKKGKKSPTSKG